MPPPTVTNAGTDRRRPTPPRQLGPRPRQVLEVIACYALLCLGQLLHQQMAPAISATLALAPDQQRSGVVPTPTGTAFLPYSSQVVLSKVAAMNTMALPDLRVDTLLVVPRLTLRAAHTRAKGIA
jgi:hypothetical protein